MKSLKVILDENVDFTIHHLAEYMKAYIDENWQSLLQENEEKWKTIFLSQMDSAYAFFGNSLLNPVFDEILAEGFTVQRAKLATSLEHWGPPEERERCLWHIITNKDGSPLGSIVLRVFHDHTQFRIPYAPDVFGLEEIEAEAIKKAISQAPTRVKREEFLRAFLNNIDENKEENKRWEYSAEIGLADCLNHDHSERSEAFLDYALSIWGRYNWELITVVPHQGKLIAFFKREMSK